MRRVDQRRAGVVALYQHEVTGRPLADLIDGDATPFTRELVDGVLHYQEELDSLIEQHAKGWTVDRIAPLERSILRVSLFEMLHREDIPPIVSINEAVDIAKKFSTPDSGKFVNGILDKVKGELLRPARIVK